jgi:hypothetical protein
LIAIARKVIILDLKEYDSTVLILTISGAYYIVRRKLRIDLSESAARRQEKAEEPQ